MAAALFLRCFSFPEFVNPGGGFYFYSIDSYDHLRRITLGVKNFPAVPAYDYYAAYPAGLGQVWAPLFDYFISALCLLLGGSRELIEGVCFFTPPFLAAASVVAVFFAARASFGTAAAVVAAFVLALHPGSVSYSIPMNFDHHSVEPLIVLLLFSLPLMDKKGGALARSSFLLWVASLLLCLFTWRGSTIYWGFSFVSILGRCLVADDRRQARSFAGVYLVAAALLSLYCLFDPWGNAGGFSFGVISWFHTALLVCWAVILHGFGMAASRKVFLRGAALAAACCVVLLAAGALGGVGKQLIG